MIRMKIMINDRIETRGINDGLPSNYSSPEQDYEENQNMIETHRTMASKNPRTKSKGLQIGIKKR